MGSEWIGAGDGKDSEVVGRDGGGGCGGGSGGTGCERLEAVAVAPGKAVMGELEALNEGGEMSSRKVVVGILVGEVKGARGWFSWLSQLSIASCNQAGYVLVD